MNCLMNCPVMIWFLHGNMGLPGDWGPVSKALQGMGVASRSLNLWKLLACCPKTLTEAGDLIAAEISSQDHRPVLCGYSLGGRLGLHAVCRHPELWAGAVFVSTHPGLQSDDERSIRRASDAEWAVKCLEIPWNDVMTSWHEQGVLRGNKREEQPALSSWKRSIARGFVDWSLGMQEDFRQNLRQLEIPWLWVCGEKDPKFSGLGREVAGDGLVLVPGSGHRVPAEQPILLADILCEFYKKLGDE